MHVTKYPAMEVDLMLSQFTLALFYLFGIDAVRLLSRESID